MAQDAEYTHEYFEIIADLDGDIDSRRAAFGYMESSTAIVHHQVVASSFVPRLFGKRAFDAMKNAAETAHGILCKVMQHYIDDPDYRRIFNFDERLEELILLPRGYNSLLPFARVDTFLNEDDYTLKFCEFNGDGSAGMNENREITNSIKNSQSFKVFSQAHKAQGCDLFKPWVERFLEIYDTYENKVANPQIAICDYLENGVVDEFQVYADLFKQAGTNCFIADVRDLNFDGNVLKDAQGNRIDAIWRRCVTNDVIEHWDESQALIDAVRAQKVALIGSFAGHIVHDKQIFHVLFDTKTQEFLSADEISFIEQTVPTTTFLDEANVNLAQIKENKDLWIIKPTDHYGADNVYAGSEVSQEKWEELIELFANSRSGYPFIVQRYCKPFRTETLPPDFDILNSADGSIDYSPAIYNNMNGLYLFDGHFQGVFSRLGPHETISKQNDGITAATIWVDADVEDGWNL
ncbi:glutathionylspermidine synthase family protein [Adlercreutzia sp. ZJ304]|uniref:glutathionylspermidine synthase family protein n=1 Tax=Adlercreutzia sp. ZJ304 TaxID=2709791 RepID=UPI0013EB6163|nr:glutathionylspermidine synthase family protein [Adlercreutzia sp. ZJ304]